MFTYPHGFMGGYGNDMALVMATTGAAETITIPCLNLGTFDATINWGDGTTSTITTYNDADLAHEYADAGDHIIRISGTFPNIYFNNGGDKLKLKKVLQLGNTGLTWLKLAFWGCTNLTDVLRGVVDTSAVTDMRSAFSGCTSLTTLDVSGWNTALVTDMGGMFFDCSGLTTLDVSGWNTALVTNMSVMFSECTGLTTLDVSGWNTALVIGVSQMFNNCTSLTDVAIDGWNIEAVTNPAGFMFGATLPTNRYDATLIAWDAQDPINNLEWNFGNSKYTGGGAAAAARQNLIDVDLWTIYDGGIA